MSLFYKKCEICGYKIKKRVKIFSPLSEIECKNCKTVYKIKQPLILKILISILDEIMFIIILICGAYLALYIDENFY